MNRCMQKLNAYFRYYVNKTCISCILEVFSLLHKFVFEKNTDQKRSLNTTELSGQLTDLGKNNVKQKEIILDINKIEYNIDQ